jgi:tetratricopeptide (TPR) repeat protein
MKRFSVAMVSRWKMILFILVLPFSDKPALSQNNDTFVHKVDSLKSALVISRGVDKYKILDQLAFEYVASFDTMALQYATEAFKMSWEFGDSARIVKSGRYKAMAFSDLSEFDSAIVLSQILLPIARRNNYLTEMKYVLNLLALAHTFKAEYDKALAYNFESLELRKKHEDKFSVAVALGNTGLVYYKMKSYAEALEYFEKAQNFRSVNSERLPNVDKSSYEIGLVNISLCYAFLNDLTKAGKFVDKVYQSCQDGCGDHMLMMAHFASGVVQFKRGNMDLAAIKFLESLSLARKVPDQRFELDNLIYVSQISLESGKVVLAEQYLKEAEALIKGGLPFNLELVKIYSQLFQLYTKLGNYQKVATYQSKYIQLKDSIYNEEVTTNLMKVEAEYREHENKAKLEAQEKILMLNKDMMIKQRALNGVVGVVAIMSIALAIVLIQNVKQKKRANHFLEQKVKERTMELEVNHNELLKSMEERNQQIKRISAEVKSSMATIRGLCKLSLQDASVVNAGQYIDKIERASDHLQSGIHRTLGISENGIL